MTVLLPHFATVAAWHGWLFAHAVICQRVPRPAGGPRLVLAAWRSTHGLACAYRQAVSS